MSPESGFSLRKWYLDCVAENGDAFIGYSAVLRWNGLVIHYSSVTTMVGNSEAKTKTSLRAGSVPQLTDRRIDWSSNALAVQGTWEQDSEQFEEIVYRSPEGSVSWSCLQPRSVAVVSLGKTRRIAGFGYAELLELTIKPWRLPITQLRWGRWHSASDALVWIDWQGGVPFSLLLRNGKKIQDSSISDDRIVFGRGRSFLTLSEKREVRNGTLASTSLRGIPRLMGIVPAGMLQTHECKWRSKGLFAPDGSSGSSGWAIHEIVRFA